jgi:alpha-beta hydrolase superfamily lysophospholipase
MGAAAILKAAADDRLQPAALILECPFDRLRTAVDRRFEERRLPAFPMSSLLVFWGGWRLGFDGFAHNPVEYARRVTTPALLIGGMADPLVSQAETRSIADALGTHGRLLMCPGVGHAPCLRGRPGLWRTNVSAFVDGVLRPAHAGG